MITEIFGVDPGIVNSGVVCIQLYPDIKKIAIHSVALIGPDAAAASHFIGLYATSISKAYVYQEKYKPRGTLHHNVEMVKAEQSFQQALGSKLILNTGVKKIVRRPLIELLGVWSFTTKTHHQDLRSAARIGIYGALKDEGLNTILADVVRDHLQGRTWNVTHY